MALIQCPNCGKNISSAALKCPHCGFSLPDNTIEVESVNIIQPSNAIQPIKDKPKRWAVKLKNTRIAAVFVAIAVLAGIFWITNRLTPEEKYQVQAVTDQINSIGQVEIYSGDKIKAVESQYEQLSTKCRHKVKNARELKKAKNEWNTLCAEKVSQEIDKLGEVKKGAELKIQFAETNYNKLTDEQKKLVKNYGKLTEAKEKLSDLRVQEVKDLIASIGEISLNKDTKDKISKAEQSYNGTLSDEEKEKVDNYSVLQKAHEEFAALAVKNCTEAIDRIGEVTLESAPQIHEATEAYLLVFSEDKDKVLNHLKLDDATKQLLTLQEEEEVRKKTLAPGASFSNSKWSVTYKKARISAKILPNSTYGYYTYYYCTDDSVYVDLVFNVKNVNTDMLSLDRIVSKGSVTYAEKYTYSSYTLFTSSGNDIDKVYSWDGLDALQSTTLHVAFIVPREAQSNDAPIRVVLTIAGEEKIINVR